MKAAVRFKQPKVDRQQGEIARLRILQGPDQGAVFVIVGPIVKIGRGDESDVMISDLKASRLHAELSFTPSGWKVRDLASANGILLNGRETTQGPIRPNETITIGATVLEFIPAESPTRVLNAPSRSPEQLNHEQAGFLAQQERVRAMGAVNLKPVGLPNFNAPKPAGGNNRVLIIGGALVAAVMILGGDPPPKPKAKKADGDADRTLAQYMPSPDAGTQRSADRFLKEGMREYRERNYLRAQTQFETVLQIAPGHPLATKYLQNSKIAIADEIKSHQEGYKKAMLSGKLKSARAHLEAIRRLLFREPSNPAYIQAGEDLLSLDGIKKGGAS
ncbi:FHA domain-containing protein [bacterium]|jgi:hypothetical protein|nr:FHA domain-containing protein [bacterium]